MDDCSVLDDFVTEKRSIDGGPTVLCWLWPRESFAEGITLHVTLNDSAAQNRDRSLEPP